MLRFLILTYLYHKLKSFFNGEPYYKIAVFVENDITKIIDVQYANHYKGLKKFNEIVKYFISKYKDKKYKYAILDNSSKIYLINNKHFISKKTFDKLFIRKKSLVFSLILKFKFGSVRSFEEISI